MSRPEGEAGPPSRATSRYADWNVLEKWSSPDWDDATREVVQRRLHEVPPIRFLTPGEAATLAAVAEQIVPQHDREPDQRVPIVPWIDAKLHLDQRDGYRYAELPPLRAAWRAGLGGIDESARLLGGATFALLDATGQRTVLRALAAGRAPGTTWLHLPARRFFRDVLCITVVKTYYAHPAAWSEIGYSGPAAVRGHVRNWMGGVDPWDAPEGSSA